VNYGLAGHNGYRYTLVPIGLALLTGLQACALPVPHPPCELPEATSDEEGRFEICGLPITVSERDKDSLADDGELADHQIAAEWSANLSPDERGLARARCERPRVADLHPNLSFLRDGIFVTSSARSAFVKLTPAEFDRWLAGEETDLKCVLDSLAVQGQFYENHPIATVQANFSRPYSSAALETLLSAVPGVENVTPADHRAGELPFVRVSIDSDDVATWLVRTGYGDCPSGCLSHQYYMAVSDPAGPVTLVGNYDDGLPLAGTPPPWIPEDFLH